MDNIINSQSFFLIINGKSNSGKSHLVRWLMREISIHNPFSYGIVMSNTAFEGSFDYIPNKYIFEDFNEDIIRNVIKIQKKNIERGYKNRAFIVLDDCCSQNEFMNPVLKKLAVMGRHYFISIILTSQYTNLIPPTLRSNSNFSIYYDIGEGVREMRAVYESYGQRFKSYDEFRQFYYKNIENHQFIMYCDSEYKVFRCPEKIPQFKITFNKKPVKK